MSVKEMTDLLTAQSVSYHRHPKISYDEFKEVQNEHFRHLDRVGGELLKGFREHLWVAQGRLRQRRQLYRNGALFLIGISVLDYVILTM